MAGSVEFTTTGLSAILMRLRAITGALDSRMVAANAEVEVQVQQALRDLYGERLAKYWVFEGAARAGGALARVRVQTDDPRVRGYEFGTRPHPIVAVNARALAFQWNGAQAFYARVAHPGTPAHDRRTALKIALQLAARTEWENALRGAITTV